MKNKSEIAAVTLGFIAPITVGLAAGVHVGDSDAGWFMAASWFFAVFFFGVAKLFTSIGETY
jgi:hypothetical protein